MLKTLALLVCSTVFASSAWLVSAPRANPSLFVGPGGILEMHRQLFAAMDRGDVEAVKAFVSDERSRGNSDGSIFLADDSGAPAQAWGSAASRDLLARAVAADAKSGGEWKTTITKTAADCPSGELSFAMLEFERVHTIDGKSETKRYRSTSLVRFDDNRWKLFHWHVSPASAHDASLAKK